MDHTIKEIIDQCKLRWELSDDFTPAELKSWSEAADTILSEVESESDNKVLDLPNSPIMKSLLSHCVNYIENILTLRPDIQGKPDGSYYNYDETYNIFLENLHNEIEQYFRQKGYFQ